MLARMWVFDTEDDEVNMFNFFKKKKESKEEEKKESPTLSKGLARTRTSLIAGLKSIFSGKAKIDQKILDDIEERLLISDVGVGVTNKIIDELKKILKRGKDVGEELVLETIKSQLVDILKPCDQSLIISDQEKPFVILLVGVNGAGKTTTIGKLANKFQKENFKVTLAAGDTFRAAAIEQLKIWGERNDVDVIAQKSGGDSAAVIYDAFQSAKARNVDVLIADTAGRLHTHQGFMDELKKVKKTIQKIDSKAPHEVLLVLDATIGQNALNQVKEFNEMIGVTGICITKLDGTAKGGAIFAIAQESKIPIRFIGIGEGLDDLRPFDAKKFVDALFGE